MTAMNAPYGTAVREASGLDLVLGSAERHRLWLSAALRDGHPGGAFRTQSFSEVRCGTFAKRRRIACNARGEDQGARSGVAADLRRACWGARQGKDQFDRNLVWHVEPIDDGAVFAFSGDVSLADLGFFWGRNGAGGAADDEPATFVAKARRIRSGLSIGESDGLLLNLTTRRGVAQAFIATVSAASENRAPKSGSSAGLRRRSAMLTGVLASGVLLDGYVSRQYAWTRGRKRRGCCRVG